MKTEISHNIKTDIKGVIGVILHEVDLRNSRIINGVIPVQVLSKKFKYAEDVAELVQKINEGEKNSILSIISEYEFNESLYTDRATGERMAKLMQMKKSVDLVLDVEQAEKYIHFLIIDIEKLERMKKELEEEKEPFSQDKNHLKSINLISASLEPTGVIFLILDERFENPIRCVVKNSKGYPAYIKKLYDVAYLVDAPNKKVNYSRNTADNINNGLFRKRQVAKYMKTNKFKKPTLVQKSEKGTLVLKNEIPVKTGLIKNDVPSQYQSLYIDKTK